MRFLESMIRKALAAPDAPVASLVLGLRGSIVVLADGRVGVGWPPSTPDGSAAIREDFACRLASASAHELATLYASPFPQESAAASAAIAALCPPPEEPGNEGAFLESLIPLASGGRAALLGSDWDVADTLRDWGWNVTVFEDPSTRRGSLPRWTSTCAAASFSTFWLAGSLVTDGSILSLSAVLPPGHPMIVQGPGIPYVPEALSAVGVRSLVLPRPLAGETGRCLAHIGAGGSPWLSPYILWRVFSCERSERSDRGVRYPPGV